MSHPTPRPKLSDAVARRMAAGLMAVRARSASMHQGFGLAESMWKHDGTRVTAVDLSISKGIFEDLRAKFPEDQFFSEETEPGGAPVPLHAAFAWILDPVDGTNNYALGIPMCAISLALLERGVPVCGFVYDLGTRTLLHGGPDIGLFADGKPLARHPAPTGDTRIVAMHSPMDARHMPVVNAVLQHYKLRGFGSGALHLAYVALGRVDACLDFTVRVWDIAAAWAFCQVTGVEVWFFDAPAFPMREFDLHMKPIRYLAADPASMAELKEAMSGKL
jgi:myo-inositol-1(or 4)-monophosphatase